MASILLENRRTARSPTPPELRQSPDWALKHIGDYEVVYGQGAGQDHIDLAGITSADLAWVQDSFQFQMG